MQGANPMEDVADALMQALGNIPLEAVPSLIDALLLSTGVHSSSLLHHLIKAFPGRLRDQPKEDEQFTLESKEHTFLQAFVSALTHLFKKPGCDMGAMAALVWIVYVPLLKRTSVAHSVLHDQVADALAEIARERQSWEDMQAILVPYCLRSVVSSISIASEREELLFTKLQDDTHPSILELVEKMRSLDLNEEDLELIDGSLPLAVACHILSTLLLAALRAVSSNEIGMQLKAMCENDNASAEYFARQMVTDLLDATLNMLSQPSDCLMRHYAMRMLLPPLLRTVDILGPSEGCSLKNRSVHCRGFVMRRVWNCCKSLFSHGSLQRRDAYMAVSLFLKFMLPPFHDRVESSEQKTDFDTFDVRAEGNFWEEIRAGLVDGDHLTRKTALQILKSALQNRVKRVSNGCLNSNSDGSKNKSLQTKMGEGNALERTSKCFVNGCLNIEGDGSKSEGLETKMGEVNAPSHGMTKRDKWAEMEAKSLGIGMVNNGLDHDTDDWQCWEAFILLYEMLEEYGTHLVEAAWSHQISLLLPTLEARSPENQAAMIWDRQSQLYNLEVAFMWTTVLWQRGFDHGNPQVRRLIMQSFLELDWMKLGSTAMHVPEWFVIGPFMQALNDPVHHKDFGLRGVYYSETSKSAAKFIRQYSASLCVRDREIFVQRLASFVKCESLGRAGLMSLALCIKAAACGDDWIEESGTLKTSVSFSETMQGGARSGTHNLQGNISADLVEILRLVVENSKRHFNPNYRSQVCDHIIVAASAQVVIYEVPFDKFLKFLSSFPREFIVTGGVLHSKIMHWFSLQDTAYSDHPLSTYQEWIAQNLCQFSESFVKPERSGVFVPYDDEEMDAWRVGAERWARLLCIGALEEDQFSQIFIMLQNHASEIYQRVYNSSCMPEKLLLLIVCLLKECQPEQWFSDNLQGGKMESARKQELADLVGGKELSRDFIFVKKISHVILSILGELVSYARSSSTIFWSEDLVRDAPLPGCVTGKLGGPSQRRLPSSATSGVLQA